MYGLALQVNLQNLLNDTFEDIISMPSCRFMIISFLINAVSDYSKINEKRKSNLELFVSTGIILQTAASLSCV